MKNLMKRIGYTFSNPALLKQALTHCSAGMLNNERFEFLGDSILNFVIAHALFEQFPNESEGQLSRLRAYFVNGDMLADIAVELSLGDHLILGQGELKSGGFRRSSILADALEAIIAATFLDGGFEHSRALVLALYASRLDKVTFKENLKDYKTQLQEYLQALKKPLPDYQLIKVEGEEHEQIFHVKCRVFGVDFVAMGQGTNRRKAEQAAASLMLNQVKGT